MKTFKISDKIISNETKPFIIAEIGLAHMGAINLAHSFIDAVSSAGADAIKFQMHIANEESTLDEKFRVKISPKFKSRYDYWEKTSFTNHEWQEIINHCKRKKLIFLCTPFSVKAAQVLNKFNIEAFKVGSGEILFLQLFDFLKTTKKPILFSTGLSNTIEIDQIVRKIKDTNPFAIFECTSYYPTPPQKIGLNLINKYKKKYKCPIGLSDHSGNIFAAIAAMAIGANLIEVHVTPTKDSISPDTSSSITIDQLKDLVKASNFLFSCLNSKLTKDQVTQELNEYRNLFFRSFATNKDLKKGHVLKKEDLQLKKPGTGIKVDQLNQIIGRKLKKSVTSRRLINIEDLE